MLNKIINIVNNTLAFLETPAGVAVLVLLGIVLVQFLIIWLLIWIIKNNFKKNNINAPQPAGATQ